MAITDIGQAIASDLSTAVTSYSVDAKATDGATGQEETIYQNSKWEQYHGYYRAIAELGAAIDAKATWTIGKGFVADDETTVTLENVRGWGKDTFNTILENCVRIYHIGGDSFCEIILDEEGEFVNLKPLDPGAMVIVVDKKGMIKRYEQVSKIDKAKKIFQVEEIFHLARNRVADEIHGVSIIERLEKIILMRNEAMADFQEVFHRFVKPKFIFHLDTDDATKIAAFKSKNDAATGKGENIYIPKDAVVAEQIAVAPQSTLNPLPWINALNSYFFQAAGVPAIILGNSQEFTEATAKIAYLAFQQAIEEEQLYIEEQVREQLGFKIELEFPASIEKDLLSDVAKDKGSLGFAQADTTVGVRGRR